MQQTVIHTLGVGECEAQELLGMLHAAGIVTVVDIRTASASPAHPSPEQATLRSTLEAQNIVYHWAGRQLGGPHHARADSVHRALEDEQLRGFADAMGEAAFQRWAQQLINLAARSPLAILCAERPPQSGYCRLLADYLTLRGFKVLNLLGSGRVQEHLLSPEARRESFELVYDRRE